MTFSKTSKSIREFFFRKITKLIVKDSFKYLDIWDNPVHTNQFFKNWGHFRKFQFTWESPFSDTFVDYFSDYGKYESQNRLRILAGMAPWHVAFFEFKFMISCFTSLSCTFLKSN